MISIALTVAAAGFFLAIPRFHRIPVILLLSLAVVAIWSSDGLGAVVGSTTLVVGGVVSLFAARQFEGEPRGRYLPALMACVIASAVGLVLSRTPLTLLAAWTASSLLTALTLLVAVPKFQRRSLLRLLVFPAVADVALAAVVLTLSIGGSFDAGVLTSLERWALWSALAVAALARSGATWRSSWVTKTVQSPTAVSALLHAGVVNAGAVLIIRFAHLVDVQRGVMAALALAAAVVIWSLAPRIHQRADLKGQLAVSTVSQMAFMLMMVALGWPILAITHMVGHAAYKAYRFVNASAAIQSRATRRTYRPLGRTLTGWARLAAAASIGLASLALVIVVDHRDVRAALGIFGLAGLALWWRRSASPQQQPWLVWGGCASVALGYPVAVELVARVLGRLPSTGVATEWWVPLVVLLGAVLFNVVPRGSTTITTTSPAKEHHRVNA